EIPSPRTGVIAALMADEGQVVPVGTVIVTIEVAGAATGAPGSAGSGHARAAGGGTTTAATAAPPISSATASSPGAPVQATPAVRQLAKQLGVVLETVRGSGPSGRITTEDVQAAAGSKPTPGQPAAAPDATGVPSPEPTPAARAASAGSDDEQRVPL